MPAKAGAPIVRPESIAQLFLGHYIRTIQSHSLCAAMSSTCSIAAAGIFSPNKIKVDTLPAAWFASTTQLPLLALKVVKPVGLTVHPPEAVLKITVKPTG